ncbi:hypothetical protein Plhal304r1_c097g0173851 [Plasmopara halstedii]
MSDVTLSSSLSPSVSSLMLPGSTRPDYRGKCLYKTGKCVNERALKTSGAAHNLCDEHRNRQNQHQRKLDAKNRVIKRERGVLPREAKTERFAPYPVVLKYQPPFTLAEEAESVPLPAVASSTAKTVCTFKDEKVMALMSEMRAIATTPMNTGVMVLPDGPQPPLMDFSFVIEDFDGIVVPLPSFLKGQERNEFRSRVYQKVLDFISEECILRSGEKVAIETTSVAETKRSVRTGTGRTQTEHSVSIGSADNEYADAKASKIQES